jgi:Domain of unknown function (DUF5668)
MAPRIRSEGIVAGFSLIGLGLLWMLSNLGWLDLLTSVRRWWPLVLVVWGAAELLNTWTVRNRREVSK